MGDEHRLASSTFHTLHVRVTSAHPTTVLRLSQICMPDLQSRVFDINRVAARLVLFLHTGARRSLR